MINRERKVDVSKLSQEQVDDISRQVGERIRQICDSSCDEMNKILNIYGMNAKLQVIIDHLGKEKELSNL